MEFYNIEENRRDKPMVLVTNEILEKFKNSYEESLSHLNSLKSLINNNDYLKLEEKYYVNKLTDKEKEVFIDYKNNLEKLQLDTNIKKSYSKIMYNYKDEQIEYATFVSEQNNDLNFISGDEYGISSEKIDPILKKIKANNIIAINIHNHPRDSNISIGDLYLLSDKNISAMHIISGNRIQIYNKLENFNELEFNKIFNPYLRDLLIDENKNYSDDFTTNKLIQHNIKNLKIIEKNIIYGIVSNYINDLENNRELIIPFDNNSRFARSLNITVDEYYENFEKALTYTLNILKDKIEVKEIKL